MQKTFLGKTDLKVSVIGLGGLLLWKLSMREAKRVIEVALDEGINLIDTAEGYGDSEAKIGKALNKKRGVCILATKSLSRTSQEIVANVEKSLKRFKTDYIDLYQVHQISKPVDLEKITSPCGALEGLLRCKKMGKIRHIGVTGHDPVILQKTIETVSQFESVQFPFNIVENEKAKFSLLEKAREFQVGTIIMKPLAGGVIPEPGLSLRWILQQGVDTTIPGMVSPSEIRQNASIGKNPCRLSPKELVRLKEAVKHLQERFCRRCMYCMPCPEGIPIDLIQEWGDRMKGEISVAKDWCRQQYSKLEKNAEDCVGCGECEEKCPYELPIRKMLQEKHKLLTS